MAVPSQFPRDVRSYDNGKTFAVREANTGPVAVTVIFPDAAQGANSQVIESGIPAITDPQNRGINWIVYFQVKKANKASGDTTTYPYTVQVIAKDTGKSYFYYDGSTIHPIQIDPSSGRGTFALNTEDPAVGMG